MELKSKTIITDFFFIYISHLWRNLNAKYEITNLHEVTTEKKKIKNIFQFRKLCT